MREKVIHMTAGYPMTWCKRNIVLTPSSHSTTLEWPEVTCDMCLVKRTSGFTRETSAPQDMRSMDTCSHCYAPLVYCGGVQSLTPERVLERQSAGGSAGHRALREKAQALRADTPPPASAIAPACPEGEGRACGAGETPTPESK